MVMISLDVKETWKINDIEKLDMILSKCRNINDIIEYGAEYITVNREKRSWKCTVCSNALINCELRFDTVGPTLR